MAKDNDKIITDLLKRVEKIESVVFGKDKNLGGTDRKDFKGATGGLRLLASKGFFNKKHTFGEIKKTLAENGYHYSNQAVQTPLNNFSRAGGLLVGLKEGGKKVYAKRK